MGEYLKSKYLEKDIADKEELRQKTINQVKINNIRHLERSETKSKDLKAQKDSSTSRCSAQNDGCRFKIRPKKRKKQFESPRDFDKSGVSKEEIDYLLLYYKKIKDVNLRIKAFDIIKYISTVLKN